jgi:hypothetical protein
VKVCRAGGETYSTSCVEASRTRINTRYKSFCRSAKVCDVAVLQREDGAWEWEGGACVEAGIRVGCGRERV